RLDVARIACIVAERTAQLRHDAIEHARCHMAMAPDRIEQGFTLDRLARAIEQDHQHRVRLGFHADHAIAPAYADRACAYLDIVEAEDLFVVAGMLLHVFPNAPSENDRPPSVGTIQARTSSLAGFR